MNWSAVAAIMSVATMLSVILGVVYGGGKMSQQIADHAKDLKDHGSRLDGHDAKHTAHEIELAKLNQWKDGFNAAAGVSGGSIERRS